MHVDKSNLKEDSYLEDSNKTTAMLVTLDVVKLCAQGGSQERLRDG